MYTQFINGGVSSRLNGSPELTIIQLIIIHWEKFKANDQDVEAAVNSSEKAFHIWRNKTGAERGRVLLKTAHVLRSGWRKLLC